MDDWQIGDLALCVGADGEGDPGDNHPLDCYADEAGFAIGSVYIVDGVFPFLGEIGLYFTAHPSGGPNNTWSAACFRKVPPLSDAEHDSFLADLREPSHDLITAALVVAAADDAAHLRVGHFSPLGALPSSLPGPSADDTSRHADGSGLLFNRAHAESTTSQRQ